MTQLLIRDAEWTWSLKSSSWTEALKYLPMAAENRVAGFSLRNALLDWVRLAPWPSPSTAEAWDKISRKASAAAAGGRSPKAALDTSAWLSGLHPCCRTPSAMARLNGEQTGFPDPATGSDMT